MERTSISRILDRMPRPYRRREEWVIRQTVQQRDFLHDLEDGVFDRGCIGVG